MCFPELSCICYPLVLFLVYFDKSPCPASLNIVLYPSHWQPPLTVPRQKRQPLSIQMQAISDVHFFFPHKAVPQVHVSKFLFLAKPLHHPVDCHPLRLALTALTILHYDDDDSSGSMVSLRQIYAQRMNPWVSTG